MLQSSREHDAELLKFCRYAESLALKLKDLTNPDETTEALFSEYGAFQRYVILSLIFKQLGLIKHSLLTRSLAEIDTISQSFREVRRGKLYKQIPGTSKGLLEKKLASLAELRSHVEVM